MNYNILCIFGTYHGIYDIFEMKMKLRKNLSVIYKFMRKSIPDSCFSCHGIKIVIKLEIECVLMHYFRGYSAFRLFIIRDGVKRLTTTKEICFHRAVSNENCC